MKTNGFDDFLRGEDVLSRLLREALPAFEPPASLEARFREQLAQMQATRLLGEELMFEAPPSQNDAFARLAAEVQTAQAPRRDAVLEQLQEGRAPEEVLGAQPADETVAWLRQQQRQPAVPARQRRSGGRLTRFLLWGGGGALASVMMLTLLFRMQSLFFFGAAPRLEPSSEVFASASVGSAALTELAQLDPPSEVKDTAGEVPPQERLSSDPAGDSARSHTPAAGAAAHDHAPAKAAVAGEPPVLEEAPETAIMASKPLAPVAVPDQAAVPAEPSAQADREMAKAEPALAAAPPPAAAPSTTAVRPAARSAGAPLSRRERVVTLDDNAADVARRLLAAPSIPTVITLGIRDTDDPAFGAWLEDFRAAVHASHPQVRIWVRERPGSAPRSVSIDVSDHVQP